MRRNPGISMIQNLMGAIHHIVNQLSGKDAGQAHSETVPEDLFLCPMVCGSVPTPVPAAFTAPISVLEVVEPEQKETSNNTRIVTYIPATVNTQADFIMVQPEEQPVQTEIPSEPEEQLRMTPMHAIALLWAAGTVGLILYSVVQFSPLVLLQKVRY